MAGQLKRISGPAYMGNAVADIYTPPAATIYTVIRHIRIDNKTAGAVTFVLFIGATGAQVGGTEIAGPGKSVAAGDALDLFFAPGLKMLSSDFLTGFASAASSLTITVMGEQYVV